MIEFEESVAEAVASLSARLPLSEIRGLTLRQVQGFVALFRQDEQQQELLDAVRQRVAMNGDAKAWKEYIKGLEKDDGDDC